MDLNLYYYKALVTKVIDGDTIDVMIDLGFETYTKARLRFSVADTPEIHGVKKTSEEYKEGMEAKNFVVDKILDQKVIIKTEIDKDGSDKKGTFKRYLATIYYGDEHIDLNAELLEIGLAEPYDRR